MRRVVVGFDAAVAMVFGVLSAVKPVDIYGTIVDLTPLEAHHGTVAALTSMSLFYVLWGGVAVVALFASGGTQRALLVLLALRHVVFGVKGLLEAGASWQVGSPLPDLVIHGAFTVALLVLAARQR